jgi:hypothetical protein
MIRQYLALLLLKLSYFVDRSVLEYLYQLSKEEANG